MLPGGEIVRNVVAIPLADIEVGERMRPVEADWAEGLAGIMARDGQLTPIEVCRLPQGGFALVTGGHRLAAASINGWAEIEAIIVSSKWAERRLREVSENLFRRDLDPADRAAFMAELIDLARAADGTAGKSAQQVAADVRWSAKLPISDALNARANLAHAYGWSDRVAERLGVSVRTVKRDLQLHRRLSPQVKAMLAGHPVYRNASQLQALANQDPSRQLELAQMLVSGSIRSVNEGLATLQQRPKVSAEDKRLSAVLGAIHRMGKLERQAAFDQLAGQYTQEIRRALAKAQSLDGAEAE
jgi:ParB-like chromosome segregation protein Spo0J